MKIKWKAKIFAMAVVLCLVGSVARSDSLELKNGSLIKGRFISRTDTEISFQVGSSVQKFQVADIASLKLDSETKASDRPRSSESAIADQVGDTSEFVTVPAGTRISVRTIDGIDSSKNRVGDRFQATLVGALVVDGNVVAPKGTDVYGRLEESKTSGTFTGRSELRLELTGIVVNGLTVPVVTGDYELSGKSRGASTAKRTVGGAALGSIIGAIAGGGKGAAIGAGVGAGAGAGSEIITKGDHVNVPSETLLEFTLEQSVSIPTRRR